MWVRSEYGVRNASSLSMAARVTRAGHPILLITEGGGRQCRLVCPAHRVVYATWQRMMLG